MKKITIVILVLSIVLAACLLFTGCEYDLGIEGIEINEDGELILKMPDGTVKNIGEGFDTGNFNIDVTNVQILNTEVIDGYLWITYAVAPDTPIKLGKIKHDGTEGLCFNLLSDGTYGVKAGETIDLEEIVIPATYGGIAVTQILPNAFEGAANLKNIFIPDSIMTIEDRAFYGCSSLISIDIPDTVTYIGNSAFCNCSSLTSIEVPYRVKSIGYDAFRGCSSLASAKIGYSVTNLGSGAFYKCSNLTSITLGENITGISQKAFYGCSSLTSITIPDSVTYIGEYAFFDCNKLTSVRIPESVTSIYNWAFAHCKSLINVRIPCKVESIGKGAFLGCNSLTTIYFDCTKKQWNAISKKNLWNDSTGDYTIHCTDGNITK